MRRELGQVVRGRWWLCFCVHLCFLFDVISLLFFSNVAFAGKGRIMSLWELSFKVTEAQDKQFYCPTASLTFKIRATLKKKNSADAGKRKDGEGATVTPETVKTSKSARLCLNFYSVSLCRWLTPNPCGLNYRMTRVWHPLFTEMVHWYTQRWMTDGTPMPSPLSYHYLIPLVAITSEGNKKPVPGNYYRHGSSMNNTASFSIRPICNSSRNETRV